LPVDRPTFHESWYRVADLRPRLLTGVKVYRQHFRGQLWYVLENPADNQYSRLSREAYFFVGALNGHRTVSQVWQRCNEQYGDLAPTQGEVIQLLGQLHAMNLLYADLPPDAESLFNRYRKRVQREVLSYLANLLFARIPLLDPDAFLDRWVGVLGIPFSWLGFLVWLALLAAGLSCVAGNFQELIGQSANVLDPGNLILLYLSLVAVKIFHEFSHAFACKRFGRLNQSGGQVHSMGVMFMVLFPLPYVDASSAWAFRNKWHRAIVGMAGIMAELAIASVAAIVWTQTAPGTLHSIMYNIIFVASVSTVLFNGNFLLRFDAYYILADLLEIPNLSQRAKNYLYYLVKRYPWGLKKIQNPAYTTGEKLWFVVYGLASTAYRIYISIRILLFLNNRLPEQFFIVVPILALSAVIAWVVVPIGQFLRFLAASPELARSRQRAVLTSVGFFGLLIGFLAWIPMPDYWRLEGIVEPRQSALIHAESDGFATGFLPSESTVTVGGAPLIQSANPQLDAQKKALAAQRQALEAKRRLAELQEVAAAQVMDEQIAALDEQIARVKKELASLNLAAPFAGTWVAPDIDRIGGTYIRRGQKLGFVGSLDQLIVRATAGQDIIAELRDQADKHVELRPRGRPDIKFTGRVEKIFPSGQDILPSQALGYPAGGHVATNPQDREAIKTIEPFFEIRISPGKSDSWKLFTGQRVVARIRMQSKPLLTQVWQAARRLFQRRFHI
jgi:putative peptide zinc metalloprotease protein